MNNRTLEDVGEALLVSARAWDKDVCLLGNVRAIEVESFVLATRVLMTTITELAQITRDELEARDSKIAELEKQLAVAFEDIAALTQCPDFNELTNSLLRATREKLDAAEARVAELSRNMGHFAGAIGTAAGLRDVGFKAPEQIVHAVQAQADRVARLETRAEDAVTALRESWSRRAIHDVLNVDVSAPAVDSTAVQVAQARALVSLWRQCADRAVNSIRSFIFRECAQELEDALNWKKAKP